MPLFTAFAGEAIEMRLRAEGVQTVAAEADRRAAWAAAAGYEALVLTVDTPVAGPRLRDVRNGLTIPPSLTLRTVVDGATRPRWWWDLLTTEPLEFALLDPVRGDGGGPDHSDVRPGRHHRGCGVASPGVAGPAGRQGGAERGGREGSLHR